MTTYNTGNALGSSDARDLYDNAENIDRFANGVANTYQDRLGVTRKSLAGMRNAFDDFIESSGYTVPVAYTSGIVLSEYNQLIEYNDEFYKLKAGQAPYTTTGTWGTDSAKLVAVGDAALRQELTANANDFNLLPEIDNYAALQAYTGDVTAYYVRGVANIFDGGAGVFRVDAADTTTADNGGTVLVDASGRRWKREFSGTVNVRWFGAKGDGTNESSKIYAARDYARSVNATLFFPASSVGYYAGQTGFDFGGDGLVVIGDGMPEYSSDWTRLQPGSGTIFLGIVDMTGSRNSIHNCGVDCGAWFRTTINGGIYAEGLRNSELGNPDDLTTYNKDFCFGDVRILLSPADSGNNSSWGHCLLVERVIGVRHGYVECHGGYHGYVIKSMQVSGSDVVVHGQLGSTYIIKSDSASSFASEVNINSIQIGHPLYTPFTNGRGILESAGKVTRNIHIGQLIARNCDTIINRTGSLEVVGVTFGLVDYSDGNIYLDVVKIDSAALDWHIGTHRIRDCYRGFYVTGGLNVGIGDGSVTNAYSDGYVLQGDIHHGVIRPINCGGYGVKNNGCFDINPSRIQASNCTSGAIDALTDFSGSVTPVNGFSPSSGFSANLIGNQFLLKGEISNVGAPTGSVVLNVAIPYRPKNVFSGTLAAYNTSAGTWASFPFTLYTSGDLLVHGASAFGAGSIISIDAVSWTTH